jgi:hypothetical protein
MLTAEFLFFIDNNFDKTKLLIPRRSSIIGLDILISWNDEYLL